MILVGIILIVSMLFYGICMIPNYLRMSKVRKDLKKIGIDPDFLLLKYLTLGDFHTNLCFLESILDEYKDKKLK